MQVWVLALLLSDLLVHLVEAIADHFDFLLSSPYCWCLRQEILDNPSAVGVGSRASAQTWLARS